MKFDNVIGQDRVKKFFQKAFEGGRISHAYLLFGERGVGKEAAAVEIAKALLCPNTYQCKTDDCPGCSRVADLIHPDLDFIFPCPANIKEDEYRKILTSVAADPYNRLQPWAKPSISIERIRGIRHASSYKSFEGRGRVEIIVDCEKMTTEASNALLKILEEPPDKMHLIMISSRPNLLLPTITSRCQVVKFDPLTVLDIETALSKRMSIEKKQASLTARLAGGSFRRALELLDENIQEMQGIALDFFRKSIQNEFIQILFIEETLHNFQRDLKKVKDLLMLLTIWFRDAIVFRETGGDEEELFTNFDQMEILSNFTKKFPDADLDSAVREIEYSLELLERNVQIKLIMIVLLNKLRDFLRR